MASLISKRLSRLPIGTRVSVTYGDGTSHYEVVEGVISDTDFSSSLELTPASGQAVFIDYSIVRAFSEIQSLENILRELPSGAKVQFSYGALESPSEMIQGEVIENDNEASIEIRTASGQDLTIEYGMIQSLITMSEATQTLSHTPLPVQQQLQPTQLPPDDAPIPQTTPLYRQSLSHEALICNDDLLSNLYNSLMRTEKALLDRSYQRFQYGKKTNDKDKRERAAREAKKVYSDELERNKNLSKDATRFCALLLYRTGAYEPKIFMDAGDTWEAAFSAFKAKKYVDAGAYAAVAMYGADSGHLNDLTIILATSCYESNDVSALRELMGSLSGEAAGKLRSIFIDLLTAKNCQVPTDVLTGQTLATLESVYTNTEIIQVMHPWIPSPSGTAESARDKSIPANTQQYGWIYKIHWSDQTGTIDSHGELYPFQYFDIQDKELRNTVDQCLNADLDGNTRWVYFYIKRGKAANITSAKGPLTFVPEAVEHYRYDEAIDLCFQAASTKELPAALLLAVDTALTKYNADKETETLFDVEDLYRRNAGSYPRNAKSLCALGQLYYALHDLQKAIDFTDQSLAQNCSSLRFKATILAQYARYCIQAYNEQPSLELMKGVKEKADAWLLLYSEDTLRNDLDCQRYHPRLLGWRCKAECELGLVEEAEADLQALLNDYPGDPKIGRLQDLIHETKRKLVKDRHVSSEDGIPVAEANVGAAQDSSGSNNVDPALESPRQYVSEEEEEEDDDLQNIPEYVDQGGWAALNTSTKSVIDYALSIAGPNAVPCALTYLKAGAMLSEEIKPIYELLSLAANESGKAHHYDVSSLQNMLTGCEAQYSEFAGFCAAAGFLRAAFIEDWRYVYGTKEFGASIPPAHEFASLGGIYDSLLEFQESIGMPIDIYADYRNQGANTIKASMDALILEAESLYAKFISTPPREGVKFARLLETKKLLFAQDGFLASMLHNIITNDQNAMMSAKEQFTSEYLGGNSDGGAANLRIEKIDTLIDKNWNQATKSLNLRKANADLQGSRRNNLRSNLIDILTVIRKWYDLSEQSAGSNRRTDDGEKQYLYLRPRLLELLSELQNACQAALDGAETPQRKMGLYTLMDAAREMVARLSGTWRFGQETYMFADFLNSDYILLDLDFLPDLTSTLCSLPEYNVLARLRKHIEGPKLGYQEHLDCIFSSEKTRNNYGTASRILEYLQASGRAEEACGPKNADQFIAQSERQCRMRYRSFLEAYALDRNRGRIMQSDAFCNTLEDTVRHWYAAAQSSKNFGFFQLLLQHAEERIHISAAKYEHQLLEMLDAMAAKNEQQFSRHPGVWEAIKDQITQQNFIVAEDWMNKLRAGDFSMELQQPDALHYLERFWNSYSSIFNRVGDASRSLSNLLGKRVVRNKDTKGGQQIIDCWLNSGHPSTPANISQLLGLLGWKGFTVEPERQNLDSRTEIYMAKCVNPGHVGTPLHPIAAYGSELYKGGMQVVCLYGTYDCDRLYEKIRVLDAINGTKLILLDYALGGVDRRVLAKKMKQRENGLRNKYLVIDRVLICYLIDNYNENLINRILMSLAMPFSYCQPYVVDSILTMPPEIFIGRKDELHKIENPTGVNLIYGGRQLGKSALFKKARLDVDGSDRQRAVLVDINGCDCPAAARKLSVELSELGILAEGGETSDWDELCSQIRKRLRARDDIQYLLIMLDEADAFIQDCGNSNYKPLVSMKDVQQTLPGQFKFVLAGLHNVVRFNRDVALGRNAVITHLPSLKVTPFRTPEAQELLTEPLSYLGLALPSKVTVSQILATVNYFPGLIQMYCQKLIESLRAADYAGYDIRQTPPYTITDEHIRRVMADREFVDQIRDKFEATLKLDQDQSEVGFYFPIALLVGWLYHAEPDKLRDGFSAKDILQQAKELPVTRIMQLDEEKVETLMQELQDLNILRGVSQDTYLLASKNFSDLLGSEEEIFENLVKISEVDQ